MTMMKEEKKDGVSEDDSPLTANDEEDQEQRSGEQDLRVTADYTLISRGLVDMTHVQLEASRTPDELPAPEVGDWVESKAAHQDAQIFRAKVVERRRCPENIWVFRLRSPDMTSTYIEPLKHVRKDNVWSLAREMDLAGGRKARRVCQQPRRVSSVPNARISVSSLSSSASLSRSSDHGSSQSVSDVCVKASVCFDSDSSLSLTSSPPTSSVQDTCVSISSSFSSSTPSSSPRVDPPSLPFLVEEEGKERRRTTGDEAVRGQLHALQRNQDLFLLPDQEKKMPTARHSETETPSPYQFSYPRRSLPAYHHLEKILMRTKFSLPLPGVSASSSSPSHTSFLSPFSSLSVKDPSHKGVKRVSSSILSHHASMPRDSNEEENKCFDASGIFKKLREEVEKETETEESLNVTSPKNILSLKESKPNENEKENEERKNKGGESLCETRGKTEGKTYELKRQKTDLVSLSPSSSLTRGKATRPLSALIGNGAPNGRIESDS